MPARVPPIDHGAGVMLGFASGNRRWLVDLSNAGEVLPVPGLCAVPLTKFWFRGIANVRGTFYSVTDLAAFHGDSPTPITAQSRLLLAGAGLRQYRGDVDVKGTQDGAPLVITNMALLMTRTFGIKPMAGMTEDEAAPEASIQAAAGGGKPWHGTRYRDTEGALWTCLQLQDLMSATEFLDIAA